MAVKTASDGPWWEEAVSLSRMQLHMQNKTTIERTQKEAFGGKSLQLLTLRDKIHLQKWSHKTYKVKPVPEEDFHFRRRKNDKEKGQVYGAVK